MNRSSAMSRKKPLTATSRKAGGYFVIALIVIFVVTIIFQFVLLYFCEPLTRPSLRL
jgi:hypothetical protein